MTPERAFRRMWTKADKYHTHAVSGTLYTALGAGMMGQWALDDATLGRGSFATVWRATCVKTGAVVAVKELFPSFDYSAGGESLSDANAQRVLDEAKVLLRLRHLGPAPAVRAWT